MQNDIRLVIFDWDGTLFNSIQSIVDSLQFTAQQFGYQISDQQAKDVIGLALPIALQTLFPTEDLILKERILQTYIQHNVTHSQNDQWYEGALSLLLELKKHHILLAVATGKARKSLNRILERVNGHQIFATSRCADETESKPSPAMLMEILEELQLQPSQAIMVGDSIYDMQMAKATHMPSIGITHGVHSQQILQQDATFIAHHINELRQQLLSLIHHEE